jgi:LmbE family N-acetylglucosaminyl deacetylase
MRGRVAVGLALAAVVAAVGIRARPWSAPETPRAVPLVLPPKARLLVFSPHPDDETLAAGGLIHRFARQKLPVRVVFFTNGDGYPEALAADHVHDYVALGALRRREAVAAAHRLGLTPRDVRFLGFPDGGLAALWEAHWSPAVPYTSPYTREDEPPYPDAVDPDAEYDGTDLTAIVVRMLHEFRPTVVVMPHPADTHPDHQHAAYFVTEALAKLQGSGVLARDLTVVTYLVHWPSWPRRSSSPPDRVVPDARVPVTAWSETDLTPDELAAKRAALGEYRSQLDVMGGFLRAFLCRNELFAAVDTKVLARIAAVH